MKATLILLCGLAVAAPASAQDEPKLSIRPFVMGIAQSFTAKETFDAVFEKHTQSLFGGGVQVVLWDRFVAEVGASRAEMSGERAFHSGDQNFRLGIPLTATITPVEVTGGTVPLWEHGPHCRPVSSRTATRRRRTSRISENVDTRSPASCSTAASIPATAGLPAPR
jgi:hypothetical protein